MIPAVSNKDAALVSGVDGESGKGKKGRIVVFPQSGPFFRRLFGGTGIDKRRRQVYDTLKVK